MTRGVARATFYFWSGSAGERTIVLNSHNSSFTPPTTTFMMVKAFGVNPDGAQSETKMLLDIGRWQSRLGYGNEAYELYTSIHILI
jgi:hypothetical protein